MKHVKQLFVHYTTLWVRLLQQAAGTTDPASYLLAHDARTPLFYLEGMTRVLMNVHDKKKLSALNEQFKALEDGLGAMDYYSGLLKDFNPNKQLTEFKQNLETHRTITAAQMNTLLEQYGWLETADNRSDSPKLESSQLQSLQKVFRKISTLYLKIHQSSCCRFTAEHQDYQQLCIYRQSINLGRNA